MTETNVLTTNQGLRDSKGRMLAPLPGGAPKITPASARNMAQIRWDKYRQEAVRRIVDEAASIDPTVKTGAQAFGLLAAKQFSAFMDSEKPNIDQLERLARLLTGKDQAASSSTNVSEGTISAQPETLVALLAELERHVTDHVAKATAIEPGP